MACCLLVIITPPSSSAPGNRKRHERNPGKRESSENVAPSGPRAVSRNVRNDEADPWVWLSITARNDGRWATRLLDVKYQNGEYSVGEHYVDPLRPTSGKFNEVRSTSKCKSPR